VQGNTTSKVVPLPATRSPSQELAVEKLSMDRPEGHQHWGKAVDLTLELMDEEGQPVVGHDKKIAVVNISIRPFVYFSRRYQ